ncbi:MAG: 2-amino-4-hydroxy-6-hydroxymethyldihydropteridine diphosphokinase [Bacteroidaceae bacterium]
MTGDEPQPHVLYLALGTNLGDRRANLLRALDMIDQRIGQVCRISSFLQTEPWGFSSPNTFLNAACMVHTALEPMQCLECSQQIEREMGRTGKSVDGGYADRVIDIDLLMYDDLHIVTPQLTLPHPLMMERDFVLRPLSEIMPAEQLNQMNHIQTSK